MIWKIIGFYLEGFTIAMILNYLFIACDGENDVETIKRRDNYIWFSWFYVIPAIIRVVLSLIDMSVKTNLKRKFDLRVYKLKQFVSKIIKK